MRVCWDAVSGLTHLHLQTAAKCTSRELAFERLDDGEQIRTLVPGTAPCNLRQQELLIQNHDDHPACIAREAASDCDDACVAQRMC